MPPKVIVPAPVTLAFDPSKYVNKHMDREAIIKLKEVFDLFDYDHSGQVSIEEIQNTIKALGLEKEAKTIINIVQASTSADQLDFKTFIQIFGLPQIQSEATLKQLYEVFDPQGTNCFGPEEFQKVCEMVGEKFSPQELQQMIDYADRDRDGGINFQEFVQTVTREYPKV